MLEHVSDLSVCVVCLVRAGSSGVCVSLCVSSPSICVFAGLGRLLRRIDFLGVLAATKCSEILPGRLAGDSASELVGTAFSDRKIRPSLPGKKFFFAIFFAVFLR